MNDSVDCYSEMKVLSLTITDVLSNILFLYIGYAQHNLSTCITCACGQKHE